MDSDNTIPTDEVTPGQQASLDQNMAGANDAIEYLLKHLQAHVEAHPDCPGAWCVSQPFGDAMMDFSVEQLVIIVTVMARRLVEAGIFPKEP